MLSWYCGIAWRLHADTVRSGRCCCSKCPSQRLALQHVAGTDSHRLETARRGRCSKANHGTRGRAAFRAVGPLHSFGTAWRRRERTAAPDRRGRVSVGTAPPRCHAPRAARRDAAPAAGRGTRARAPHRAAVRRCRRACVMLEGAATLAPHPPHRSRILIPRMAMSLLRTSRLARSAAPLLATRAFSTSLAAQRDVKNITV